MAAEPSELFEILPANLIEYEAWRPTIGYALKEVCNAFCSLSSSPQKDATSCVKKYEQVKSQKTFLQVKVGENWSEACAKADRLLHSWRWNNRVNELDDEHVRFFEKS